MTRIIFGAAALALLGTGLTWTAPAQAATFQNGDFSNGFDGYQVRRCSFLCIADGTNSAEIVEGADKDPYLELRAPSELFGRGQIEVLQDVVVSADMSTLHFDASLLAYQSGDVVIGQESSITDYFTLLLQTSSDIYSLFTYDIYGAREAALNTLPGLSITDTSSGNWPDAVSAYNFGADLSGFVGETVSFIFTVVSQNDGHLTRFGVDNLALKGASVTPVPLPAGGVLLLASLAMFGGLRQTRSPKYL